jgi:signal transduction histidine kinase/ActR/RegA family two-component response regulator
MTRDGGALTVDPSQLVSMMFALLPVPVAITDHSGRVVLCNSSFTDVFQGTTLVSSATLYEVEVPGRGTFQVQTLPLTDQGYQIVFAADVTEQVQMRKRVARLEKMAAVGRVVGGVATELESPLADIASYALLVDRATLPSEASQIFGAMLARAERASRLVQSLTALGSDTPPRYTPFDMNRIVRSVVELLRRHQEKAITVTLDLDEDLPNGTGDASLIEQVVLTLLMNAEDSAGADPSRAGTIDIRTGVRNDRIQLHVTDNGLTRDAARIFEPGEGGVGLNICAEIAKDHGGELYAWNAYGNGTTLTLELPVSAPNSNPAEAPFLAGKTVLVVDSEEITAVIGEILERSGAIVEAVQSGSEAYGRFQTQVYDLVICDRHMPGLNGQGLYRLAQDLDSRTSRRFLFLSAEAVPADTRELFLERGVHFLRKPFKSQELLETIGRLFEQTPPPHDF